MQSIQHSYDLQSADDRAMGLPSCYVAPQSVDNWRHTRMLAHVRPLIVSDPDGSWLTVGDGRYGSDAAYLHGQGVAVTATSLTDDHLRIAYEMGHIPAFRAENAEQLSLPERSVDYVLCKEAYHHFPRPPVALYEMLRVARKAVVLIEPLDNPRLMDGVKRLVKRWLRGDTEMQFEPSGNYLYRINVRELAKLLTAMGGQAIAAKGINDFYHARLGHHDATRWTMGRAATQLGIATQDMLSATGLLGYGLACIVIFCGPPAAPAVAALRRDHFRILRLPVNPYARLQTV